MSAPLSISIVIPIHNEEAYVADAVADLYQQLEDVPCATTVLLAENGSTDATRRTAGELKAVHPGLDVLELPDPDYGGAMRDGFLATAGDWVVNFDIDYYSADFLRSVVAVGEDADVILASKRAPGSDDRRSRFRRTATWGFNLLLRSLLGSGVTDTHGIKALRRRVVDEIAPVVVSRQDLFDTELVIRAERAGFRILEVPVVVEEQRAARSSLIKRIPRTVRGVWRIRRTLRAEGR